MNKEKNLEKTRISNYEVLCMIRNCTFEQKNELMEKIKKSTPLENFTVKSETKTLAYPVEEMKTAEYLLLVFRIDRRRVSEVEEALRNPLIIRHLTVNLDTEKKIRIKNFDKLQRNRKFKKPGFKGEKSPQGKLSKKVVQENTGQLGTNN